MGKHYPIHDKQLDSIAHTKLPSGKHTHKTIENPHHFLMAKSTISMAMFNSFLYVYQAGYLKKTAKAYQLSEP